ncbi:MAG: helix-turn-helix transcriptional regulator [Magnetococcales bacterium]|nr:helix-turn-helix transcriptional regulator [Magnetococcales bacterium]
MDDVISPNLIEVRKAANLTQEQVAERMGVQKHTISKLENNKYSPTIATLKRYAAALGCKLKIQMVKESSQ